MVLLKLELLSKYGIIIISSSIEGSLKFSHERDNIANVTANSNRRYFVIIINIIKLLLLTLLIIKLLLSTLLMIKLLLISNRRYFVIIINIIDNYIIIINIIDN